MNIKLKLLILPFFIVLMFGCGLNQVFSNDNIGSDISFNNVFEIKGNNQSTQISLERNGNDLELGNIKLINWPLKESPCKQCEVTLDRRFYPDGPNVSLVFTNQSKVSILAVSSFQNRYSADGWQFKHVKELLEITHLESNKKTLVSSLLNQRKKLAADNDCSVLWSNKKYQTQPSKYISQDVAKFKSQVIIKCLD
jgi:hypothetical protein